MCVCSQCSDKTERNYFATPSHCVFLHTILLLLSTATATLLQHLHINGFNWMRACDRNLVRWRSRRWANAQTFSFPLPSSVSSHYAVGLKQFYIIFFDSWLFPFHFIFAPAKFVFVDAVLFPLPALAQFQHRHRHCVRARVCEFIFVSAFLSPILLSGVYKPRSVLYVNVICAQFARSMTAAVVYVHLLKCECVQKI